MRTLRARDRQAIIQITVPPYRSNLSNCRRVAVRPSCPSCSAAYRVQHVKKDLAGPSCLPTACCVRISRLSLTLPRGEQMETFEIWCTRDREASQHNKFYCSIQAHGGCASVAHTHARVSELMYECVRVL